MLAASVAVVVVVADQVTKTLALHHLVVPRHIFGPVWLELTLNSGAAFGLGRGATPVVEAIVVVLVAGLVVFGRQASRQARPATMVGVGLVLGGAVGNLMDRVVRNQHGAVIDFIQVARVGRRELWPVFNVADSAIVVGAIVLVSSYGFGAKRSAEAAPSSAPALGRNEAEADRG